MIQFPSKEFINEFKKTPGAIGVAESIAIYNIALTAPEGTYMTLGGNAGKDSMSASHGLENGVYYLVDPIYDLTNLEAWKHSQQGHPDNLAWGYAAKKGFKAQVKERIKFASNGRVKPILLGSYSEAEIPKYGKYSYVFVDSDSHSHERVFGEIALLEDLMVEGGIIAFHDFGNQYIPPQQAHGHLIGTGKYENVDINWAEIFDYVRANNLEEGNDTWHTAGSEEFPKFVGACRRKA